MSPVQLNRLAALLLFAVAAYLGVTAIMMARGRGYSCFWAMAAIIFLILASDVWRRSQLLRLADRATPQQQAKLKRDSWAAIIVLIAVLIVMAVLQKYG